MPSAQEENKNQQRVVDIFQESHEKGSGLFQPALSGLASETEALRMQPKVDFNLDGDNEEEDAHFEQLKTMGTQRNSLGANSNENRFSVGSNGAIQKSILRQTGTSGKRQEEQQYTDPQMQESAYQKRRNVQFELEPSPFKVAEDTQHISAITPTNQPTRTSQSQYRNPWDLLGRGQHDKLQSPQGQDENEDTFNMRTMGEGSPEVKKPAEPEYFGRGLDGTTGTF